MKVKVVTGYSDIGTVQVSKKQFKEQGKKLFRAVKEAGVSIHVFDDWDVTESWLYKHVTNTYGHLPPSDPNPPKDRFPAPWIAVLSNIIQIQKAEWLVTARLEDDKPDIFIWIDYVILKQQPMEADAIIKFLRRVQDEGTIDEVVAPGIQERGILDPTKFSDRFCGSLVIVPNQHVDNYFDSMRYIAKGCIAQTRAVEWEVNYLTRMEMAPRWVGYPPLRQYRCWWDRSQFDNYKGAA